MLKVLNNSRNNYQVELWTEVCVRDPSVWTVTELWEKYIFISLLWC